MEISKPEKIHRRVTFLLLLGAALVGNIYSVQLFFGVNVIFGSIFWVLLLRCVGIRHGLFGAAWASLLTISLWGHPYAFLVFMAEAVFLALFLYWKRSWNMVAVATGYWIFLAPFLVYWFYFGQMELSYLETGMIYLKQAVNGVFNVTIASLIINHVPFVGIRYKRERHEEGVSLRETVFTLTVAVIVIPALAITVYNSHYRMAEMEQEVAEKLQAAAYFAGTSISDRYQELHALLSQHEAYVGSGLDLVQSLAGLTSFRQYLSVEAAYYWDEQGQLMLFDFSENTRDPMEIADIEQVAQERRWLPIKLYSGDEESVLTSTVFVHENILQPQVIRERLLPSVEHRFLWDSPDGEQALRHDTASGGIHLHRWADSEFSWIMPIPGTPQWSVETSTQARPYRDRLYWVYVGNFGMALGLMLVAVLVGMILSRALIQPLTSLSAITTELSGVQQLPSHLPWPHSPIQEMKQLVGNFSHMVDQLRNSSEELEETLGRYEYLASHDVLTGIPNRRACVERLQTTIDAAQADAKGYRIGVVFLDLGSFKPINDTMGHQVGDQVLRLWAQRLQNVLGNKGTLCRFGGDEFAIVVPRTGGRKHLHRLGARILQTLQEPLEVEGQDFLVTASIGMSMYPKDGSEAETLLKKADIAMYESKTRGKNQIQFFERDMLPKNATQLFLSTDLAKGLREGQFELYYQPLIHLDTGACVGAEALVRWNHPQWGLIMPGDFVPFAEENGQIIDLGLWVLRSACEQLIEWDREGRGDLQMSINVARRQLQENSFIKNVQQVLQETNIDPERLQFEVTETTAMQNQRMVTEVLNKLNQMGIQTAMDDFGTGHSSLACLRQLPLQTIKIDRTFTAQIQPKNRDALLVKAAAALGTSLGLKITAEGIETHEQQEVLREIGCDQGQGFYYSKPKPASAFIQWLDSWERDRTADKQLKRTEQAGHPRPVQFRK